MFICTLFYFMHCSVWAALELSNYEWTCCYIYAGDRDFHHQQFVSHENEIDAGVGGIISSCQSISFPSRYGGSGGERNEPKPIE